MNRLHFAAVAHSFLAILAGFATMAVPIFIVTAAIGKSLPKLIGDPSNPRSGYLFLNLAYSAIFAALGGYVTALIAAQDPLRHTLMLGIVVLLLGALSALQLRGRQPLGYQFALIVITPIAVLAGGLIRMHRMGYRW